MAKRTEPTQVSIAIGHVLRQEADVKGLSDVALAECAGVSHDSLTRWLNAERVMNVENFQTITRCLGVEVAEVLDRAMQLAYPDGAPVPHDPEFEQRKRGWSITEFIAAELRGERARHRVRQQDIAAAIGRAPSYVSQRSDDAASLTLAEFFSWCQAVKADPLRLLERAFEDMRATTAAAMDPDLHALAEAVVGASEAAVSPSRNALALAADGGHDLPIGSENGEGFDD